MVLSELFLPYLKRKQTHLVMLQDATPAHNCSDFLFTARTAIIRNHNQIFGQQYSAFPSAVGLWSYRNNHYLGSIYLNTIETIYVVWPWSIEEHVDMIRSNDPAHCLAPILPT